MGGAGTRRGRSVAGQVALVVLVALGVVLSGCSGTSDDSSASRKVVLVTYSGYALPESAAKAFTKRTGTKIEVLATDDAGAALARAILAAGDPEGDLFFGVDTTFLTKATGSDAFVASRPTLLDLPEGAADPSGTLVPIDESTVCVNVDREWFRKKGIDPPKTFDDLAAPRYKGLLVIEDPAASSPGLVFVAATQKVYGSHAPDYWRRLRDNDVKVTGGWSDAYFSEYTVNGGDRPLVLSYASSPPAEVLDSKGQRTEPQSTVMVDTCTRQVEYAGVLRGAKNPAGARALLAEMQSARWQAALPASNYVFPMRSGVRLPPVFERFAVRPAHPLVLDPAEVGRHRDDWLDRWRDVMG
jgi:thiamine transport system substrate-binding protein